MTKHMSTKVIGFPRHLNNLSHNSTLIWALCKPLTSLTPRSPDLGMLTHHSPFLALQFKYSWLFLCGWLGGWAGLGFRRREWFGATAHWTTLSLQGRVLVSLHIIRHVFQGCKSNSCLAPVLRTRALGWGSNGSPSVSGDKHLAENSEPKASTFEMLCCRSTYIISSPKVQLGASI